VVAFHNSCPVLPVADLSSKIEEEDDRRSSLGGARLHYQSLFGLGVLMMVIRRLEHLSSRIFVNSYENGPR